MHRAVKPAAPAQTLRAEARAQAAAGLLTDTYTRAARRSASAAPARQGGVHRLSRLSGNYVPLSKQRRGTLTDARLVNFGRERAPSDSLRIYEISLTLLLHN